MTRVSPLRIEVTALLKAVDNLTVDKVEKVLEKSSIDMSNFLYSNKNLSKHERSNSLNKIEKNLKSDLDSVLSENVSESSDFKRTLKQNKIKSLNSLNTHLRLKSKGSTAAKISPLSSKLAAPLHDERNDDRIFIDKISNFDFEDDDYIMIQEKENTEILNYIKSLSKHANTDKIRKNE